jgi:hypothetical protein
VTARPRDQDAMARCDRRSPQHFMGEVTSWGDPYFAVSEASETADPAPTSPAAEAPVLSETGVNADSWISESRDSEQVDPRDQDAMARCDRRSPKYFHREVVSWNDKYYMVSPDSETADPSPTSPADEAPVPSETGVNADSGISQRHVSQQGDPEPGQAGRVLSRCPQYGAERRGLSPVTSGSLGG